MDQGSRTVRAVVLAAFMWTRIPSRGGSSSNISTLGGGVLMGASCAASESDNDYKCLSMDESMRPLLCHNLGLKVAKPASHRVPQTAPARSMGV